MGSEGQEDLRTEGTCEWFEGQEMPSHQVYQDDHVDEVYQDDHVDEVF